MDRHVDIYTDFVIKHHVTGILDIGMFASNNKGGSDCDGTGRLQVLRLSQNGLRGSIPNGEKTSWRERASLRSMALIVVF